MSRQFGNNIEISAWNLHLAADRERYEHDTHLLLNVDLYNGSTVGRIVIETIWNIRGRNMRIQPFTEHSENAEALGLDELDATARGEPIRDVHGRPISGAGFGTGRGSSSVVRFSPGHHVYDLSRYFSGVKVARVQFDQSEVLLHEMCHGLRQMRGAITGRAMPNGLANDEEFFAILVTNIFSSQRNRPLLANHGERLLSQPESWLTSNLFQARIQRFREQMPDFTNRMAQVQARFNPFRDAPAP